MLTKGEKKLTLFQGDRKPYALFKKDKQISGAVKTTMKSNDGISWEAPYKATIPSITTFGLGSQEKMSGKNLFDGDFIRDTYIDESNGSFIKTSGKNWNATEKYYEVLPNTTYSVNYFGTSGIGDSCFYDANRRYISSTEKQQTFITPENCKYMRFSWRYASFDDNFQIELGDKSTEYEPYCGGMPAPNPSYPISPKFNTNNKILSRGKNLAPRENGIYSLFLKKGTCVGIKTDGRKSEGGNIMLFDKDDEVIWCAIDAGKTLGYKYTLPKDVYRIRNVLAEKEGHMFFIYEDGVNIPDYEPYRDNGEAIIPELRAIPNTDIRDEYDTQTGIITRRVGEIVLNGNEKNIEEYKYRGGHGIYISSILDDKYNRVDGFCTHESKVGEYYTQGLHYIWIGAQTTAIYWIGILDLLNMSLDEFKIWLQNQYKNNTPVKIYYPLKTPIEEKVDNKPLIQDWNGQLIQVGGESGLSPIEATIYTEYKD